jgi:hypothetical protein
MTTARKTVFSLLIVTIFLLPFNGFAQQAAAGKGKKTTVNFEDQLVEGQAQKPDLLYLLQKKKFNYKKLIRLRENFLPELRQSSDEIMPVRKTKEKKP